jgi:hypothetical protein
MRNEVVAYAPAEMLPIGPGQRESQDELLTWLGVIQACQAEAGKRLEMDAEQFFGLWVAAIVGYD